MAMQLRNFCWTITAGSAEGLNKLTLLWRFARALSLSSCMRYLSVPPGVNILFSSHLSLSVVNWNCYGGWINEGWNGPKTLITKHCCVLFLAMFKTGFCTRVHVLCLFMMQSCWQQIEQNMLDASTCFIGILLWTNLRKVPVCNMLKPK